MQIQSTHSDYLSNVLPIRLRSAAIRRLRRVELERDQMFGPWQQDIMSGE